MKSNPTIGDWLGQLLPIAALAGLILNMQARTDTRLDRIEDRVSEVRTYLRNLGERVARIEGKIEGTPPLATGKHITPESK